MLQVAPECQVVRISPSLPLLCPNIRAHEWRTTVTADAGDFSESRGEKPTSACITSTPVKLHPARMAQSNSTTAEAPATTSLSKDDTVVQAAMGDKLTGGKFLVMFTHVTETTSCFYPLKAHASSFTTRVPVEGRTCEVRRQRPLHPSVQDQLTKGRP